MITLAILLLVASATASSPELSGLQEVYRANNKFANDMYKLLSKQDGNVVFSPLSAHMCLSMLYQGTAGATKEACARGLKISDPTLVAQGYKSVIDKLAVYDQTNQIEEAKKENKPEDPFDPWRANEQHNATLAIANKAYISHEKKLKDSFKTVVVENFKSEIELVDFSKGAQAAETVNKWVNEKTKSKISQIVTADDVQDAQFVLLNAIYFKGYWLHQFSEYATEKGAFHLDDSKKVDVDMMEITNHFLYKEDKTLDAKVIQLPYKDSEFSMIIVLPNHKNGISELEIKVASSNINAIVDGLEREKVHLRLPKFKFETEMRLKKTLTGLGMGQLFEDTADLSGILDDDVPLKVSEVIQKVFIQVDEFGSEAAAVTGILGVQVLSLPVPPPRIFEFFADHPFMFMLVHNNYQSSPSANIMFYGRVSQPTV